MTSTTTQDVEIVADYEPSEPAIDGRSKYRQYLIEGEWVALRRGRDPGFVARDGGDRTAQQVGQSVKNSARGVGLKVDVDVPDADTVMVFTHPIDDE